MKDLITCDEATVEALRARLKQATTIAEFQRIQCVLLRATIECSASQIAQVLGWATATVHITHSRWAKEGEALFALRGKGGRRNQHLSEQQEAEVLGPFIEQASAGGVLKVSEVQHAYEARVSKAVPNSTIYRVLQRHGWRKVVPRPRHPRRMSQHAGPSKEVPPSRAPGSPPTSRRQAPRQGDVPGRGALRPAGTPEAVLGPAAGTSHRGARLERKFSDAFAAVSPHDGVMDSLVLPWVNAETMTLFLATVAERHADEFIVMVMDRAGWHIAGDLLVPDNMRLVYLPPYSPELNPTEHLWESLRERHFANTVSSDLDAVETALAGGLRTMESDPSITQKLTGFN